MRPQRALIAGGLAEVSKVLHRFSGHHTYSDVERMGSQMDTGSLTKKQHRKHNADSMAHAVMHVADMVVGMASEDPCKTSLAVQEAPWMQTKDAAALKCCHPGHT